MQKKCELLKIQIKIRELSTLTVKNVESSRFLFDKFNQWSFSFYILFTTKLQNHAMILTSMDNSKKWRLIYDRSSQSFQNIRNKIGA